MVCPNCHTLFEDNLRICPSCYFPVSPERRKEDRRKKSHPPPGGIERRKGPRRRRGKNNIAWGL